MSGEHVDTSPPDMSAGSPAPAYAWKAVYALLGATLLSVVLGIGFFTYGGIFGPLSDVGGLLVAILLAPVVISLYRVTASHEWSSAVSVVGLLAVVATAVGSLGLVVAYLLGTQPLGFALLGIQFVGWILLGVWLIGIGAVGLRTGFVSRRVSWAALVAGVGSAGGMLALTYSYAVDSFSPLFSLLMAMYVVGFTLWAYWLGGELRAMREAPPSTQSTSFEG